MKEMNGTVTLAYVEEDNRQRVIFRVIPLCTKEGLIFSNGSTLFPDEGSMRVIPDKREQTSFKERMRGLCGLCAIQIPDDGTESIKVRQNRNYNLALGEKNKLAIYSDMIYEFPQGNCFEVIPAGTTPQKVLTPAVLLEKGKMLYGPVATGDLATAEVENLKPFGNDHFQIHTIQNEYLGSHRVCWNPDSLMNWRQRRFASRRVERVERGAEETAASQVPEQAPAARKPFAGDRSVVVGKPVAIGKPVATEKPAMEKWAAEKPAAEKTVTDKIAVEKPVIERPVAEKPAIEKTVIEKTTVEKPAAEQPVATKPGNAEKPSPKASPAETRPGRGAGVGKEPKAQLRAANRPGKKEMAVGGENQPKGHAAETESEELPIGARLEILDSSASFDQQISMLKQPLSAGANRLSEDAGTAVEVEEPMETPARYNGTPLFKGAGKFKRMSIMPSNSQRAVEQQLRGNRDEVMGTEIGSRVFTIADNPMDQLNTCMELVWNNEDMRDEAIHLLLQNESFTEALIDTLRRGGINMQAAAAAEEELAEIEADRLSLLMQLNEAEERESVYREKALANITQKRKAEALRLEATNQELKATNKKLEAANKALSAENNQKLGMFLSKEMKFLSGISENRLLLSPVSGKHYHQNELSESLRVRMNSRGFSISDDEATGLMIAFALYDTLCFQAKSEADAVCFANTLLESFGLQNVAAVLNQNTTVEMFSLLPESNSRTPTITVQPVGSDAMTVFGHKTIYVGDEATVHAARETGVYPVISVPALSSSSFLQNTAWEAPECVALSSFVEICSASRPLLKEAEAWFTQLRELLASHQVAVPDVTFSKLREFLEVSANKIHGGFMAAADLAVAWWIAPVLKDSQISPEELLQAFAGFPHTLDLLKLTESARS